MKTTAPASAAPGSASGGTIWSQAEASVLASASVSARHRLAGPAHAAVAAAAATAPVFRKPRRSTAYGSSILILRTAAL